MKISRRFSTSSDLTPYLASSADAESPPAPAPTIRTGTCVTFMLVTASRAHHQYDSYYYIVVTVMIGLAGLRPRRRPARDRRLPIRFGCDGPRCRRRSAHLRG